MIRAQVKYRTFTACTWTIGALSWWMMVLGYGPLAGAFLMFALAMTGVREIVFDLEVRGLDQL
jgi:hypothetical protein